MLFILVSVPKQCNVYLRADVRGPKWFLTDINATVYTLEVITVQDPWMSAYALAIAEFLFKNAEIVPLQAAASTANFAYMQY